MKAKFFMLTAGLFFAASILLQASAPGVSGDKKVDREVGPFTKLELSVAADLHLTQGDTHKLVLEGDEDDLEDIETEVRGGTLKIEHKKAFHFGSNDRITIYVTMKDIEELSVGGSGNIEAETPIRSGDIELNVSGSGEINIDELEASNAELSISGSGDIYLSGSKSLKSLECDISGSGELHADRLKAGTADLDISGSGGCKVHVTDELEVDISGSGKVRYKGQPRVNADISGSGDVESF